MSTDNTNTNTTAPAYDYPAHPGGDTQLAPRVAASNTRVKPSPVITDEQKLYSSSDRQRQRPYKEILPHDPGTVIEHR